MQTNAKNRNSLTFYNMITNKWVQKEKKTLANFTMYSHFLSRQMVGMVPVFYLYIF